MIKPGRLFLIVLLLQLVGCAAAGWKTVGPANKNHVDVRAGYSIKQPQGWVGHKGPRYGGYYWSKDGVQLQIISVELWNQKTAFKETEQKFSVDQQPRELAEDTIAELKIELPGENVEVISNEPATISGRDGFKVMLKFTNDEGLRYRMSVYGFVADNRRYFTMSYAAPVLVYFDRDQDMFEQTVSSFRLEKIQR